MRAGGNCAVQQALTAEAAAVVKQAVVLARRRGHAQVTPLHVASTMLGAASGAFRLACLESHSHPLQCKALELCFNVALNRLPASSSAASAINPMLSNPSISNALVAAFKRAQAHQRRGSADSQQQQQPPLLAVKIELEQLIVSILDDPSVSRVMREAGFSSTQVKINVEKTTSLDLRSPSSSSSPPSPLTQKPRANSINLSLPSPSPPTARDEDVNAVIETLLIENDNKGGRRRRRRSIALVGEATSALESTVRALMDRIERGQVPEPLKEVKFINIAPLYTFCNLRRDEVEVKARELACLVQSLATKGGAVLYLGDLKWISDYRASSSLEREGSFYCSVEHMIMEIGRLVWGIGESDRERFWLIGIATFQTYMRCRNGCNSLQAVWGLHPLTIPVNTLAFTLVSESDERSSEENVGETAKLSCCVECLERFEGEARDLQTSANGRALSRLPCWLKDESRRRLNDKDQNSEAMKELCKKWNSYCNSFHKKTTPTTLPFLSPSPTSINLLSAPNSASSEEISTTDAAENVYRPPQKFKEFNAENLNLLCNALEEKVPWQKPIIPEIAGTVLQCRSGMMKRKGHGGGVREETWLLFLGRDDGRGKEKIARELAKVVFGCYSRFHCIGMSTFVDSSPSEEYCRSKRGRDGGESYVGRLAAAAAEDPRRVFLVEDLEQADYCSKMEIKRAIERGRINVGGDGGEVGFGDAIVVFSCEGLISSRSRASSPAENGGGGGGGGVCLDLNVLFDEEGGGGTAEEQPVDELGILENVDRRVVFKIQDL